MQKTNYANGNLNNIILASMEPKNFQKNSQSQFTYNNKINQNSYELNYELTYGQHGFTKDWLSRKALAIPAALYYGVVANVGQIFKIVLQDLICLACSKYVFFDCARLTHLDYNKNLNILFLDIYEIGQNLLLTLGYLYGMVNDMAGRYYIDSALLEKQNYHFVRHNQTNDENKFDELLFKYMNTSFYENLLSMGVDNTDKIVDTINTLYLQSKNELNTAKKNNYYHVYTNFAEKLANYLCEKVSLENAVILARNLSNPMEKEPKQLFVSNFNKLIINKLANADSNFFELLDVKNLVKQMFMLNDPLPLNPDEKIIKEYSYFIDLLINKEGEEAAYKFISDLPSKNNMKIKHLIALCKNSETDLNRLEYFKYFFQKNPELLGARFSRFIDISEEKIKVFLKDLFKAEPKAFEAYLKFQLNKYDNFELHIETDQTASLTIKQCDIIGNEKRYITIDNDWKKYQDFIKEVVSENVVGDKQKDFILYYDNYLKAVKEKITDAMDTTIVTKKRNSTKVNLSKINEKQKEQINNSYIMKIMKENKKFVVN